ncbi:DUF222 domain-containing protein [Actinomycetospora sp. CA-101289]|uniref:HNH endonuclease signature motif containing protein n=1 Tax=Actinomycetospora sp. CA-101289 TaxID=3239893 RepID=UPI003D99F2BB
MTIAEDAPGPSAALLDAVDPAALAGAEVVEFARRCARERNQATARFLTALHEAGRAEEGRRARRSVLDEFSGDEAAAALGWSRAMASRWLDLADDLLLRLPEVHAAMRGGDLDDTKARVFSDWTRDLCDDHAHHVCTEVLPEAPRLPLGALIERVQQVAAAIDPDWAARREQAAQRRARVVASRNPSGTANLGGYDLPVDRTVLGMARLEALAATLRRRGVRVRIENLRAEVLMTLLDGSAAGLDDDALLDLLVEALGPGEEPGPSDEPGPDDSGPDDSGPDTEPTPHEPPDDPDDEPPTEPPRSAGVRTGTVEVRVRLTTALGLDDLPATIPGWGTVLAGTARSLLDQHRDGEWRVVLTDDQGRLQHLLLARRRPRPPGPRRRERRGRRGPAIVELQVPTTLPAALVPDDHGFWGPLLHELQARLGDLGHAAPDAPDHGVDPDAARHRRPSAEVDRWVRVRDRRCVAPSCRRPAHAADLDHTVDHALGGPTLTGNLGAWCRHHHRAKHHGGWRVEQPAPGHFLVTTRAGAVYEVRPARILEPLPAPRPAPTPRPLPAHERDGPDAYTDPLDDPARGLRGRAPGGAGRAHPGRARASAQLASMRRDRSTPPSEAATPGLFPDPPF